MITSYKAHADLHMTKNHKRNITSLKDAFVTQFADATILMELTLNFVTSCWASPIQEMNEFIIWYVFNVEVYRYDTKLNGK